MLQSAFKRLRAGLQKTRNQFRNRLNKVFTGSVPLTEDILDTIEETLISADLSLDLVLELVEDLRKNFPNEQVVEMETVFNFLRTNLIQRLEKHPQRERGSEKPYVILMVGVNGTGKTTSIGKLANYYREQGLSVLLVAGDTFRAAAVEQLQIWSDRSGADIIRNEQAADPGSVVFDALKAAHNRGTDVVIIDTAGRLHTQKNLMQELVKIRNVIS